VKIAAEKRRRSTYWLLKTIKSIKEVAGLAVGIQPLGIPAIRKAAGALGTSKMTGTFRDPHIGHPAILSISEKELHSIARADRSPS
jgi:hypothetical protein